MKKLLLFVAIATMLFSCSPRDRAVKLENGSVVRAEVTNDIPYHIGSKVCVKKYPKTGWKICDDGEMMDTTIISPVNVIHRIGHVSAYLD
jgi:hypothetical protein